MRFPNILFETWRSVFQNQIMSCLSKLETVSPWSKTDYIIFCLLLLSCCLLFLCSVSITCVQHSSFACTELYFKFIINCFEQAPFPESFRQDFSCPTNNSQELFFTHLVQFKPRSVCMEYKCRTKLEIIWVRSSIFKLKVVLFFFPSRFSPTWLLHSVCVCADLLSFDYIDVIDIIVTLIPLLFGNFLVVTFCKQFGSVC